MTNDKLSQHMQTIASLLPGGWRATQDSNEHWDFTNGVISFTARANGYGNIGRLAFHGPNTQKITVSIDRTPAAIAAEITRRFMPDFQTAARKEAEYQCRRAAQADQREQLAARLVAASGGQLKPSNNQNHGGYAIDLYAWDTLHYTAEVQSNAVTLTARDVPPLVAEKILTLLAEEAGRQATTGKATP